MKKSGKLASHVLNSNNADSLNIAGIAALIEKIYDGEPSYQLSRRMYNFCTLYMYNTVVSDKCIM